MTRIEAVEGPVDPAVEEMLHSLFDGRAKHRVISDYDPTRQDKPRVKITLAASANDRPF